MGKQARARAIWEASTNARDLGTPRRYAKSILAEAYVDVLADFGAPSAPRVLALAPLDADGSLVALEATLSFADDANHVVPAGVAVSLEPGALPDAAPARGAHRTPFPVDGPGIARM